MGGGKSVKAVQLKSTDHWAVRWVKEDDLWWEGFVKRLNFEVIQML